MSKMPRRYEVLLPARFNDGRPVPDEIIGSTLTELRQRFRSLSTETQLTRGLWEFEGTVYEDQLIRVYVDVEDTPQNRKFFEEYKVVLKDRFEQLDIWLTTYPVEAL